jgi:hypothetical protein
MALTHEDELALVWLTSWDSPEDATEFFTTWSGVVGARRPGVATTRANTVRLGGAHPYYVELRDTKVLAIEGALAADLPELADRIWRRSTFEPNVPWVPIDLGRVY